MLIVLSDSHWSVARTEDEKCEVKLESENRDGVVKWQVLKSKLTVKESVSVLQQQQKSVWNVVQKVQVLKSDSTL